MKKKKVMLTFLFSAVLLSAIPGFSASKPEWVDGLSIHYPDEAYLTGVGFGDSRRVAEDSAYAAIARIFSSEVHSVTQETESFRQKNDSETKGAFNRNVEIQNKTAVSTHKVLEQIQIVERWVDPVSKVHFALATLNRSKSALSLREKSQDAETEARMWEKRAKKAEAYLARAKAFHKAVAAARIMEEYEADLRVISPVRNRRAELHGYTLSLQDQLNQVLSQHFQVEIEVKGPHAVEVHSAVLEGLHRKGFKSGPSANLIVDGVVQLQKVGPNDPVWHYVAWNATIMLKEKASGQVFGTIRRSGREGQLSPEAAERKAVAVLQSELSRSIGDEVSRFIFGE